MPGLLNGGRTIFQKRLHISHISRSLIIRPWLEHFLSAQLLYLAIAVVIYGIFWAIRPDSTNLLVTAVYTLCLCNLITAALAPLGFLYVGRKAVHYWVVFLALLLALTPVMVTITTGIVFWLVDHPGGTFWNYLSTSWK